MSYWITSPSWQALLSAKKKIILNVDYLSSQEKLDLIKVIERNVFKSLVVTIQIGFEMEMRIKETTEFYKKDFQRFEKRSKPVQPKLFPFKL